MQGTLPEPPMQTGGLSPTATTVWDRSAGSRIRKEMMSTSIMTRRDAGKHISTGTGMWSAPFTIWTAICFTRDLRTGGEGIRLSTDMPIIRTGSSGKRREEKYTYDPVGNRLKKESVQGIETYHYNAKNQLTYIQSGADILRYLYD